MSGAADLLSQQNGVSAKHTACRVLSLNPWERSRGVTVDVRQLLPAPTRFCESLENLEEGEPSETYPDMSALFIVQWYFRKAQGQGIKRSLFRLFIYLIIHVLHKLFKTLCKSNKNAR